MSENFFRFRNFVVRQEGCAMKVGTDGVLLGAWSAGFPARRALDIGTGTGLVAMILATSGVPHVEAVELDEEAFFQACSNISENALSKQIALANISFQVFASTVFALASTKNFVHSSKNNSLLVANNDTTPASENDASSDAAFDLIVCNPPYFTSSLKSTSSRRSLARHDDALPAEELLNGVVRCLDKQGVFAVIVPWARMQTMVTEACARGLYLSKRMMVRSRDHKEVSRVLLAFRKNSGPVEEQNLSIHSDNNLYSDEYKQLTMNCTGYTVQGTQLNN